MLALYGKYPQLTALPRYPLANLPTPVEAAPGLAERTNFEEVWVKRDDLTGSRYGGNKVRKLEFLLGDALRQGAEEVWTVGAIGSHHALATAVHARSAGLAVSVYHYPQPVTPHVLKNCMALAATGAKLTLGTRRGISAARFRLELANRLPRTRGRVYLIPAGGSTGVGILGYVNAALELVGQVEDGSLPPFDVVYVPLGTAGTLSGLALGFRLAQFPVRLVGVRVVGRQMANQGAVRRLSQAARKLLANYGIDVPSRWAGRVDIDQSQFGEGYGCPTAGGRGAAVTARAVAGLELDQTYTAKGMASLLDASRREPESSDRIALFLHTLSSAPVADLIPAGFGPSDLPAEYRPFFEEAQRS